MDTPNLKFNVKQMQATRFILEQLAKRTWENLRDGALFNVSQGEETITDSNLLEIKRREVPGIHIWKCPKDYESIAGIDYDMFVGSSRQKYWKRYAVQAKKISSDQRNYKSLKHDVKLDLKPPIMVPQLDLLQAYANSVNAIPLYSFYNYATRDNWSDFWNCCQNDIIPEQMGCTVTSSENVREALTAGRRGRRSFDFMHGERASLPWRCLTCCPVLNNSKALLDVDNAPSQRSTDVQEFRRQCGNGGIYDFIPDDIHRLFNISEAKFVRPVITKVSVGEDFVMEVTPKRYFILDIDEIIDVVSLSEISDENW